MTYGYMRIYEDRVRRACNTPDKLGQFALWQGGMEPNIPVGSEAGVASGMKRAVAGAEREQREGRQRQVGRPLEDGAHRPAGLGKGRPGQPAGTASSRRSPTRQPTRTACSCSNRRREPFAARAIC